MLNLLHVTADIAADRRRTLLAEAEAHRTARAARAATSSPGPARGSGGRLRGLRSFARRARPA